MINPLKTIKSFLKTPTIQNNILSDKVAQLKKLQDLVNQFLDPSLIAHCQVANLRDGCLVIVVDSAAFATQLRYRLPDLLQELRKIPELCGLKSIHHRVRPNQFNAPSPNVQKLTLSENTAKLLNQCATGIKDKALKSILQKLATRR